MFFEEYNAKLVINNSFARQQQQQLRENIESKRLAFAIYSIKLVAY